MITDPLLEDLLLKWEELRDQGREVGAEELCHQCPELTEKLRDNIEAVKEMDWLRGPMLKEDPATEGRPDENTSKNPAVADFRSLVLFLQDREFVSRDRLAEFTTELRFQDTAVLVRELVRRRQLTVFQAKQIARGDGKALIFGAYRILELIGQGGMGKVFKARHVRMDRTVALKIMPDEKLDSPEAVARFYREVRAVAQLSHPNIVTAHEVNQEGKTHYFAMEYIEGIDLRQLVRQSGPLAIPQACDYIRQAAQGLQHAHEKGLVHRDIKPGNLIVSRTVADGKPLVKILDFGLARFETENEQKTRLTRVGYVIGTVDYLSPEQARDARAVDIRSDIYSLGCSLFYLLTGKPPFQGADSVQRLLARVMNDAPLVRTVRADVPPALEAVLARMLARNPAERYPTPAEVAVALGPFAQPAVDSVSKPAAIAVQAGSPRSAAAEASANIWGSLADEQTAAGQQKEPPRKRSKSLLAILAIVVVLAVGVAGFFLTRGTQESGKHKNITDHRADKLDKTFTNSVGIEFVLVPKGKSWLGGGGGKVGEKPVEIADDFYLGKYEVMQDEWTRVMGNNPSFFKAGPGISSEEQKRLPVEMVSWDDVKGFMDRLNKNAKELDWRYRLPTRAEWEYACRGGPLANTSESGFDFYFDKPTNKLLPVQANFGYGVNRPRLVGSYQPNRLGLYDMHGNVFEWCHDGVPNPKNLMNGPTYPFLAGGCWRHDASKCGATSCHSREPDLRHDNVGFRVARFPTDK